MKKQDFEQNHIVACLEALKVATRGLPTTLITSLKQDFGKDPFIIFIACLLSLRAKDTATYPVSKRLFGRARTPRELLNIPIHELEKILYPLGFYRKKAQTIRFASQELIHRFGGQVPKTEQELLSIKGVGRKTANLVLSEAFDIPAICVDTHVHRLSNKFGWVQTSTPEETEEALKKLIPQAYWGYINAYLVLWGQHVCTPRSKTCMIDPTTQLCTHSK